MGVKSTKPRSESELDKVHQNIRSIRDHARENADDQLNEMVSDLSRSLSLFMLCLLAEAVSPDLWTVILS